MGEEKCIEAGVGVVGERISKDCVTRVLCCCCCDEGDCEDCGSVSSGEEGALFPLFAVVAVDTVADDAVDDAAAVVVDLRLGWGGGFTANSCGPSIGGGRKEEDGDGKGEEEAGASMCSDKRGEVIQTKFHCVMCLFCNNKITV